MKQLLLFFLFLFIAVQCFGIVTGQALVDEAKNWIGYPYHWGEPPNKAWKGGEGADNLYWYGWIWEWNWWHFGFDCSGLVSYCARLRRKFGVNELNSCYGAGRPYWDVAEPGDLIPTLHHIRILSSVSIEDRLVYFIHAPCAGDTVKESYDSWDHLDQINAHAYIFQDDDIGPEIIITGVEDGGVYTAPVNFNYFTEDPDETPWSRFYKGNYPRETKLSMIGEYSLNIFAIDWAKNETNKSISFVIEGPPQVYKTDPKNGAEKVDIYKNISITFVKAMNMASVESAITIYRMPDEVPIQIKEFFWSDKDKVDIRVYDPDVSTDTTGLQFSVDYKVIIKASAKDSAGNTLDGNYNLKSEGSPDDDYPFSFTTRNPEFALSADPWLSKVEIGGTQIIGVMVTNEEQRALSVSLSYIPEYAPNWTITLGGGVNVPANETVETDLIGE